MVFDFLKRGAGEAVAQTKASATGPVVAYQTSGRVAWSPRDVVSLTRTGFCGNPVGFRSVKLIAEAAAALPLVLQDAEQRFETHPLLKLVARPNGAQGRAELLEALYAQLLLTGNGYIEAVGAGPVPAELHVLRSDRMSVVPGADGWPVAYEYAVGGRKHRFDVSGDTAAICHIKNFTRRTIIMALARCRRRRWRWMCTRRRRGGARRCWTTQRGPRGRLCTAGPRGRAS